MYFIRKSVKYSAIHVRWNLVNPGFSNPVFVIWKHFQGTKNNFLYTTLLLIRKHTLWTILSCSSCKSAFVFTILSEKVLYLWHYKYTYVGKIVQRLILYIPCFRTNTNIPPTKGQYILCWLILIIQWRTCLHVLLGIIKNSLWNYVIPKSIFKNVFS